jgi:hypothetical protein
VTGPKLKPSEEGTFRYSQRLFNFAFVWNLAHKPRRAIFAHFLEAFEPAESDSVLDYGAANLPEPLENIFELYYPYKRRIVAVGEEDCSFLEKAYPGLRFVRVKRGERLPFADNSFDLGFSNAVIEHAGSRDKQALFLAELIRVCQRCLLATPNRWFPFELHTRLPLLHWLPAPWFRAILARMGFEFYAQEENLNLLSARELLAMVPPGDYQRVFLKCNYFLGFPSNLILVVIKRTKP